MTELLSERIRRLRQGRKLTLRQLGELMGVSNQAVARWESAVDMPTAHRIALLASILNCSTDYLLTGREAPQHAALIAAVRAAGSRDSRLAALVEGR